jgi:hypothetical protein
MQWLIIGFVWALNFAISFWNARSVGVVWVETKQIGGFQRFMTWMGAVMSACGFTWCYLILLLVGAYYGQFALIKPDANGSITPLLTLDAVQAGLSLGYLIIIPGILFSGLMIWIDSLVQAWRRRDLPSMGIAAWNTYAQIHNTYSAMRGIPEAVESISKFFFGGRDSRNSGKGALFLVLIFIVVMACISGILTTWGIINHYAGTRPLPQRVNHA